MSSQPPRAYFFAEPLSYSDGIALQEALLAQRIADEIGDAVLFLQHRPVITLGRRGRRNFLLVSEAQLSAQGIEFYQSSRGGDVTFHGPGQLVMYPIIKQQAAGPARAGGAHGHLDLLEQTAIRSAQHFGVEAFAREGMSGAWSAQGKLAAIGFAMKRWVSYHGVGFNLNPDLSAFDLIVGCGLQGEAVSSLAELLGDACPEMAEFQAVMLAQLSELSGISFEESPVEPLLELLAP